MDYLYTRVTSPLNHDRDNLGLSFMRRVVEKTITDYTFPVLPFISVEEGHRENSVVIGIAVVVVVDVDVDIPRA